MRFLAIVVVWLTASVAAAQDSIQNTLMAETLFREGQALMKTGAYAQACEKFAASHKIDPAVGTVLNLANCQEKNGKLATAWVLFTQGAAMSAKAGQKERENFARSRAEALLPRLNRLRVELTSPSADEEVRLDGTVLPKEVWGTAVPVDAGPHKLEVTAPGCVAWSWTVDIAPEKLDEVITVPRLEPPGAARAEAAPAPAPEPKKVAEARKAELAVAPAPPSEQVDLVKEAQSWHASTLSERRLVAVAAGGVGLAALGVGVGLLASAASTADERDAICAPGALCYDQRAFDLHHDAQVKQQWGLISGGAGVVAIGAAVVLAVLKADEPESAVPAPEKTRPASGDEFTQSIWPASNGDGFQVVAGGVW